MFNYQDGSLVLFSIQTLVLQIIAYSSEKVNLLDTIANEKEAIKFIYSTIMNKSKIDLF